MSIDLLLYILAAVCFAAAVVDGKVAGFGNWIPLGLLFWVLTNIIG